MCVFIVVLFFCGDEQQQEKKTTARERETEKGKSVGIESVFISHCSHITVKWRVHRNAHRWQQHKANVQTYLIHFSPSHPQQFPLSQFDVVIIVAFVVDDVACVFFGDCFSLGSSHFFPNFFYSTARSYDHIFIHCRTNQQNIIFNFRLLVCFSHEQAKCRTFLPY